MTSEMTKKIALITGGNRGLGKDMALSLARMGMDVVLTFNSNQAEGEAVADEIRASGGRAAACASISGRLRPSTVSWIRSGPSCATRSGAPNASTS